MKFQKSFAAVLSLILLTFLAVGAAGQAMNQPERIDNSTYVFTEKDAEKMPIAMGNNLYCAGYIQNSPVSANVEIVGSTDEKDQHIYAEGDVLYLNSGAANGVKVGDMFSVIRPRGKVYPHWTPKNSLGIFVEELGAVEVVSVKRDVSVAVVKNSCAEMLFGDLVTPMTERQSPMFSKRAPLDLYADPSGKATGKIVMSREGREMIGSEEIVYIDLGREDNVSVGDYLTIFRPLGTGNLSTRVLAESIDNKEDMNESNRYKGGHFSNQSPRKKGENAGGATVTTEDAKSRRPGGLRRVLGEMVVLNVKERTATAVVVRAASEIHTGDHVEVQ